MRTGVRRVKFTREHATRPKGAAASVYCGQAIRGGHALGGINVQDKGLSSAGGKAASSDGIGSKSGGGNSGLRRSLPLMLRSQHVRMTLRTARGELLGMCHSRTSMVAAAATPPSSHPWCSIPRPVTPAHTLPGFY